MSLRRTTTLRKSDTVRFVFGDLNYHNQISIKDNGRGDAYGCIYVYSRGVPRVLVPSRTLLGVLYTDLRGIDSVRSIEMVVVGQSHGAGSSRYPAFRMRLHNVITNHSDIWVSVGLLPDRQRPV